MEAGSEANTEHEVTLDQSDLPGQGAYHLLNALVSPRPIAWVSTVGPDGVPNVAPHSYFTVLSYQPPILGFVSIGEKDTIRNIRAAGEYAINIVGYDLREQMNRTSGDFPPEEDEFAWAKLTTVPCDLIRAPRVGEAPASMELRLLAIHQFGNGFLIAGEVLRWHIRSDIMRDGRVDPALLRPIGRHAGNGYSVAGDFFEIARPTWSALRHEKSDE